MKIKEKNNYKNLKVLTKNRTLKIIDKISKKKDEANKILSQFKKIDKTLDNADLVCTKTDNKTKYDFNRFSLPLKFIEKIHNYEITLDEAINNQKDLNILINKLNNDYKPRNTETIEEKKRVLKSARKLQNARKNITNFFGKGIFPYRGNVFKKKEEQEKTKTDMNEVIKNIAKEEMDINEELFKKYFEIQRPSDMLKYLYQTNDKEKISIF